MTMLFETCFRAPEVDKAKGVVTGYAARYGRVDDRPLVFEPGAFDSAAASINGGNQVPMLWQHDSWDPLGKWTEAEVDSNGIILTGPLSLGVTRAKDALELVSDEVVTGLSIGFHALKVFFEEDDNGMDVRHAEDIEIGEGSLVTFPAMGDARITEVQSLQSRTDWEKFLRKAGLSRNQAKGLLAKGYPGLEPLRKAVEDGHDPEEVGAVSASIKNLLASMET